MPTLQEQCAEMTLEALDTLFRTARATPEEKRTWSPMAEARTVQSQLVECALMPHFLIPLLRGEPMVFDETTRQKRAEAEASLTTLEAAEAAARQIYSQLAELIRSLPDETLQETRHLPFRGGMTRTVAQVMFLPHWNLVYHTGQINYIQTMLGDKEMH